MNTSRDHSPELRPKSEAMLERSQLVDASALGAEAALYAEFWDQPASRPANGAGSVINHTFVEAQRLQSSNEQAIIDAQRQVLESIDELSA